MKIYYTIDETTNNCEQLCPVYSKLKTLDNNDPIPYVGSCTCKECEFCYGHNHNEKWALFGANKKNTFAFRPNYWVKCGLVYNKPSVWLCIKMLFYKYVTRNFYKIIDKWK